VETPQYRPCRRHGSSLRQHAYHGTLLDGSEVVAVYWLAAAVKVLPGALAHSPTPIGVSSQPFVEE
jgi:hypothetical protein